VRSPFQYLENCQLEFGNRKQRKEYVLPLEAPVMMPNLPSRGRYPATPPRFVDAVRACSGSEVAIVSWSISLNRNQV